MNDPETSLAESQQEVSFGTHSRNIRVVPSISYCQQRISRICDEENKTLIEDHVSKSICSNAFSKTPSPATSRTRALSFCMQALPREHPHTTTSLRLGSSPDSDQTLTTSL